MKLLTRTQLILQHRFENINKYFNNNQALVDSFLPLKNTQVEFKANLLQIVNLLEPKFLDPKVHTQIKFQTKKEAAQVWLAILAPAHAFCLENNMLNHAENLNFSQRKLIRLKDGYFHPLCIELNKLITNHLLPLPAFTPYQITSAKLADALLLSRNFDNHIAEADVILANQSAAAISLKQLFNKLQKNNKMFTGLMQHFKTSQPKFFNGYLAVNKSHTIIRHTGIAGNVTNAKTLKPIAKATITNTKNNKTVTANLLGEYKHHPNRAGSVEFTCSAPGYETTSKNITLQRGTIIPQIWQLQPE